MKRYEKAFVNGFKNSLFVIRCRGIIIKCWVVINCKSKVDILTIYLVILISVLTDSDQHSILMFMHINLWTNNLNKKYFIDQYLYVITTFPVYLVVCVEVFLQRRKIQLYIRLKFFWKLRYKWTEINVEFLTKW